MGGLKLAQCLRKGYTMKITIQVKSNYGVLTAYPICPVAKAFAELAGTKTLTNQALLIIERMGYEIEQQTEKLSFIKG